jgi:hypothetical protein
MDKKTITMSSAREERFKQVLFENYRKCILDASEIQEHLPILSDYAASVNSVLQVGGTHDVCVLWSFVAGLYVGAQYQNGLKSDEKSEKQEESLEKRITVVDASQPPSINTLNLVARALRVNLRCVASPTLKFATTDTYDIVFIDGWHCYGQVRRELIKFAPLCNRYLILHDTSIDEYSSESVRLHVDIAKQVEETGYSYPEICTGIWPAIVEFLKTSKDFRLVQRFSNCNGLTILERVTSQETDILSTLPTHFDWRFYLFRYEDLRRSGVFTEVGAKEHYLYHGRFEKREYAIPDRLDTEKHQLHAPASNWYPLFRTNEVRSYLREHNDPIQFAIVIATYQRKDGSTPGKLRRALQSIREQVYDNFLVYLVGDCYDDNDEFRSYASLLPEGKIQLINLPEPGERGFITQTERLWHVAGAAAMNTGLNLARKANVPYYVHLDDDDCWSSDHLLLLAYIYHKFPRCSFVYTQSTYINFLFPGTVHVEMVENNLLPCPGQLTHSAASFRCDRIPFDYFTTRDGNLAIQPADAQMWNRIHCWLQNNPEKYSAIYIPIMTVYHYTEKE